MAQRSILLQVFLFFILAMLLLPANSTPKKTRGRLGATRTNVIEVETIGRSPRKGGRNTSSKKNPTVRPVRIGGEIDNMSSLTKKPTNLRKYRIFCKVGHYLVMKRRGDRYILTGSMIENIHSSPAGIFEIQSFGSSVVRIKSVKFNRYIMMDRKGRVTATNKKRSSKTLFRENHEDNLFISYASYRYYTKEPFDMFLGLSKNGKLRSGRDTNSGQEGIQFLVAPLTKMSDY